MYLSIYTYTHIYVISGKKKQVVLLGTKPKLTM